MRALSRTIIPTVTFLIASGALLATTPVISAEEKPPAQVLFTNVNIFDGKTDKLAMGMSVLVEGNLIKAIGNDVRGRDDAKTIDGAGRTLMPGLIDTHQHLMLGGPDGIQTARDNYDFALSGAIGAIAMRDHILLKGFTSVRDIAGNSLSLAKAVKNGVLVGPRIFSSGPSISQTGGHSDWGYWSDRPGDVDKLDLSQQTYVVDGVPEAIRAVRSNFRRGAAFIKIMAGGGMASDFDPIEVTQFSLEEMRAMQGVADDYGSYICVHAYHDRSINRALDAGIKCIEHGFLISEKTVKRMKKEGAFWGFQSYAGYKLTSSRDKMPSFFKEEHIVKALKASAGLKQVNGWMRKHGILIHSGSDLFGTDELWGLIHRNITVLSELGYSNAEALMTATGNAGKVLMMTGPMNPYKDGTLGVIEKGAYADILLWNGNPLENLELILEDEKLQVIMKDGVIYKNTL
jgi:imidazolonepropionase-like amidohydrolase